MKNMDKAEATHQDGSRGLGNLSLQSQFLAEHHEGLSEEIELSLELSLGGRFGVDKHDNKLMRSSSVVWTTPIVREDESSTDRPFSYATLIRTSSLPAETEEEWTKRKELQTRRRMEAKRRRSEKQRNSKVERENSIGDSGLPSWAAAAARQVAVGGAVDALSTEGRGSVMFHRYGPASSQGSMDSQGRSSSGLSEMENKPFRGLSNCQAPSPTSTSPSLHERSNPAAVGSSTVSPPDNAVQSCRAEPENPSRRKNEIGMKAMEDMPCVFTKGVGPNGRRVEGILYKYGKGEEVRIMCVCHGNFLSPAEFVKHAGGGEVAHPMRHIVVNPSTTTSL